MSDQLTEAMHGFGMQDFCRRFNIDKDFESVKFFISSRFYYNSNPNVVEEIVKQKPENKNPMKLLVLRKKFDDTSMRLDSFKNNVRKETYFNSGNSAVNISEEYVWRIQLNDATPPCKKILKER